MLADELLKRDIGELLHFTTNRGIVGVLDSHQLLSRHRVKLEDSLQYILHVNATSRPEENEFFDKKEHWLDYVNLSISEINRRYFEFSQAWHLKADIWWGILSFDAIAIADEGVYFTTTNNTYDQCIREKGLSGFNQLFQPVVKRKTPNWNVSRLSRAARLPTCEQAEVLYPGALSAHYLRRVYVQDETCQDTVIGWLREFEYKDVEVIIDPQKFKGIKN